MHTSKRVDKGNKNWHANSMNMLSAECTPTDSPSAHAPTHTLTHTHTHTYQLHSPYKYICSTFMITHKECRYLQCTLRVLVEHRVSPRSGVECMDLPHYGRETPTSRGQGYGGEGVGRRAGRRREGQREDRHL